jgi:nitroreductase/dihydropteridine reductase
MKISSYHIIRVGLAITFLWIGVLIFKSPEGWGTLIQPWAAGLLPVSLKTAMIATAILDLAIGLLLLIDINSVAPKAVNVSIMPLPDRLNWRYSVKKFDPSKQVSLEDKEKILEAIRLAPSSFGFQPYHLIVVEEKDLREKLALVSPGNEPKILYSSFLLVFCANADIAGRINSFAEYSSGGDAEKKKASEARWERIKKAFATKSKEENMAWAAKQMYIALGFALATCAELVIDSCPMEGFDKEKYKEILKLPENLYPQALLAVGYRAAGEPAPTKVRFPKLDLFEEKH